MGVAVGNGPLRWVAKDAKRLQPGGATFLPIMK